MKSIPPDLDAFLREPNPAVVATLRPDGSPNSVATWYDWEDGLVLLNMDATRKRLEHLRRNPRASVTVLDKDDWYTHVSLFGVVERIEDDEGLVEIDRLAVRYTGNPYRNRESPRVSAWMRPTSWHRWPPPG
ncbi:MAG TPA: PPOX class F420-dependent oxidoreductase [Gaiellaceae bacterium]|nr:PPOX class F420-dependent oxidoreductase [Gaiellaceae bacterium]